MSVIKKFASFRPEITIDQLPNKQLAKSLNSTRTFNQIEKVLPDSSDPWPISQDTARFLARLVVDMKCRNILEFGAGYSSMMFANALSMIGGGQLTSVESDPDWCMDKWREVQKIKGVDSQLIVSKPNFKMTRKGFYHSYESASRVIAERGPYDLVLIDGPQTFYGRDGSLHLAYDYLKPNALIVLDDAQRRGEQWTIQRWLQTYSGLNLTVFDPSFAGRGVAVFINNGHQGEQVSLNTLFTSGCFALKNWYYRRDLGMATA